MSLKKKRRKAEGEAKEVSVERGKKEREAKDKAAIDKGIKDAKKTGIKSGQTAQGGMSLKAREQAAYNREKRVYTIYFFNCVQ